MSLHPALIGEARLSNGALMTAVLVLRWMASAAMSVEHTGYAPRLRRL